MEETHLKRLIKCGLCIHQKSEMEYAQKIFFCSKNHWVNEPDKSNDDCLDHKKDEIKSSSK